jgi:hypothetical protein
MTAVHGPEQGELTFTDPSPLRDSDRRLILGAILFDARQHDGHVDPNRVRESLRDFAGDLMCNPRALSGAYRSLRTLPGTRPGPTTVNNDKRGGNAGKPLATLWVDIAEVATLHRAAEWLP